MKKTWIRILAGVSLGILAVALCIAPSPAKSPAREVMFWAYFAEPGPVWHGVLKLWIDGTEYEGTGEWQGIKGKFCKKGAMGHFFATGTYTFPGLGSFDFSERSKLTILSADETGHYADYSGIERITGGTGAFENAEGVFNFEGYHQAVYGVSAVCSYTGHGMIHGIELP